MNLYPFSQKVPASDCSLAVAGWRLSWVNSVAESPSSRHWGWINKRRIVPAERKCRKNVPPNGRNHFQDVKRGKWPQLLNCGPLNQPCAWIMARHKEGSGASKAPANDAGSLEHYFFEGQRWWRNIWKGQGS